MSIIKVKVATNSSTESVEFDKESNIYKIRLKASPVNFKANEELIRVLSKYFKVKKAFLKIIKGQTSKNKTIKIEDLT